MSDWGPLDLFPEWVGNSLCLSEDSLIHELWCCVGRHGFQMLRLYNEEGWIEGAKLQVLTGLCSAGLPSSSLTSTTQQNPLRQMPPLYMVQIGIQIRGKSFPLFEQIAIDSPPSQVRAPDGKYFHWLTANRLWSSHWINSWIRKLAKAHNLIFASLWITAAWWDCFSLSLSFQLLSLLAPCSPIYQT